MNSAVFQSQFLEAITELANTKKLSSDEVIDILSDSIKKAFMREDPEIVIDVQVDLKLGTLKINKVLKVIETETEDFDDINEIVLDEAKKTMPNVKVGDLFFKEVSLLNKNDISKQMVQYVLQLFKQRIAELTNKSIVSEWIDKVGTLIYAEVEKKDERNNAYIINLETTSGYLQRSETIRGENLQLGKKYWFVIKAVKEQSRGWPILLSRADERLLEYLMTSNIPELEDKTIEIKKIARAAGQKSKVAVISNKQGFDPIGAIVGFNGDKIKSISSQIGNELIDILIWSENYEQLVVNAIAPVKVVGINIVEDSEREKSMEVFVDDESLPNVIGRAGINVKLLAKLSGWNIDVKSISQAKEENIEIKPTTYVPESNSVTLNLFSNNRFNNSKDNRNNSRRQNYNSQRNTFKNSISNQSLEDLVSFSTKQNTSNDIVVDLESPVEEKTKKSKNKSKINLSQITELSPTNIENLSSINENQKNEKNDIAGVKPKTNDEIQNLIETVDFSKEPKRQIKEIKLPTEIKEKENSNSNKKKNKRTIIDDFSMLDSDSENTSTKDVILIDEDDEE
ncbi:transcription termination factor NusA [Mycoplasmoides pirum]|uniref:transcription termination factor NusA n=1 Tax=Mycoplasmoides pirum TaxID=2122 RepID=UPI00069769E7|nr:transcription termination factor NusA [Mycoplasmoides pirum]